MAEDKARRSRRFNEADFCMTLACTPREERAALIGDDPRRQEVADHFLAVAAQCPKPGPQQIATVRAVFRRARHTRDGGGTDA